MDINTISLADIAKGWPYYKSVEMPYGSQPEVKPADRTVLKSCQVGMFKKAAILLVCMYLCDDFILP